MTRSPMNGAAILILVPRPHSSAITISTMTTWGPDSSTSVRPSPRAVMRPLGVGGALPGVPLVGVAVDEPPCVDVADEGDGGDPGRAVKPLLVQRVLLPLGHLVGP